MNMTKHTFKKKKLPKIHAIINMFQKERWQIT